uniref:Uncharacterized protein n=1 Tax=Picea glauca TaxID=3330 RepID=A0A101LZB4_PICGL|nr:hypothetical protein ABT39_MTgene5127 [Picea glauca]QHR86418.1 hypothetical protein Q903MT_gene417 [Picea sitchensis]
METHLGSRGHNMITLEDIYRLIGVPITGHTPSQIEVDRNAVWVAFTRAELTGQPDERMGLRLESYAYMIVGHQRKVIMAVMGGRLLPRHALDILPM